MAAVLIAVGAILGTLVIPGLVAARNHVFFTDQMGPRLPANARKQLEVFGQQQAALKNQLAVLDSALTARARNIGTPGDVPALVQLRGELETQLSKAKPPIAVLPFYLNPQMLLWPAIYTCLGWLILLFRPQKAATITRPRRAAHVVGLGVITYAFYEWPLWLRNFVFNKHGRTVFAYPNFDVDRASFFVQELTILGFCILLATVWLQWAQYLTVRQRQLHSRRGTPLETAVDPERITQLSEEFIRWQIASAVLGIGFLFFTNFFWKLVAGYHDQRYLLSAILAHLLWAVTWIVISLPLIVTWRSWNTLRLSAVAQLFREQESDREAILKIIQETRPVTSTASLTAAVSAFVSFVLPLLQLVK